MPDPSATTFLNVDLDVVSRADLTPLVAHLEPKAYALHSERRRGVHFATIELSTSRAMSPDRCIAGLARLVERLPLAERALWDGARTRVFDIGIQSGADGQVDRPRIAADTLAHVAALRGDIVVTVYPSGWGEERPPPPARARRAPRS